MTSSSTAFSVLDMKGKFEQLHNSSNHDPIQTSIRLKSPTKKTANPFPHFEETSQIINQSCDQNGNSRQLDEYKADEEDENSPDDNFRTRSQSIGVGYSPLKNTGYDSLADNYKRVNRNKSFNTNSNEKKSNSKSRLSDYNYSSFEEKQKLVENIVKNVCGNKPKVDNRNNGKLNEFQSLTSKFEKDLRNVLEKNVKKLNPTNTNAHPPLGRSLSDFKQNNKNEEDTLKNKQKRFTKSKSIAEVELFLNNKFNTLLNDTVKVTSSDSSNTESISNNSSANKYDSECEDNSYSNLEPYQTNAVNNGVSNQTEPISNEEATSYNQSRMVVPKRPPRKRAMAKISELKSNKIFTESVSRQGSSEKRTLPVIEEPANVGRSTKRDEEQECLISSEADYEDQEPGAGYETIGIKKVNAGKAVCQQKEETIYDIPCDEDDYGCNEEDEFTHLNVEKRRSSFNSAPSKPPRTFAHDIYRQLKLSSDNENAGFYPLNSSPACKVLTPTELETLYAKPIKKNKRKNFNHITDRPTVAPKPSEMFHEKKKRSVEDLFLLSQRKEEDSDISTATSPSLSKKKVYFGTLPGRRKNENIKKCIKQFAKQLNFSVDTKMQKGKSKSEDTLHCSDSYDFGRDSDPIYATPNYSNQNKDDSIQELHYMCSPLFDVERTDSFHSRKMDEPQNELRTRNMEKSKTLNPGLRQAASMQHLSPIYQNSDVSNDRNQNCSTLSKTERPTIIWSDPRENSKNHKVRSGLIDGIKEFRQSCRFVQKRIKNIAR